MSILVTLSFGRPLFWWAIGYELHHVALNPELSFFKVLICNTLKKLGSGAFDLKLL